MRIGSVGFPSVSGLSGCIDEEITQQIDLTWEQEEEAGLVVDLGKEEKKCWSFSQASCLGRCWITGS